MSRTASLLAGRPLPPPRTVPLRPPARPRLTGLAAAYLAATALAMSLGTFVLVEPAPVDLAIMGLLAAGLLIGGLALTRAHAVPAALLAVFMATNVVSMVNAMDGPRSFWYGAVTLYLALSWIFFVGLIGRYGDRARSALFTGYAFAGVVSVTLGTLAYFGFLHYQELLMVGRPKGLFKDPNVYGPYMVPIALYAMAKLVDKARGTLVWIFLLAVSVAGIFLSYSRACWINCVVAVFAFVATSAFLRRRGGDLRRWNRLVIGLGLAVLCVMGSLTLPGVRDMVKERWGEGGLHDYDQARFETQRKAFATAFEVPLGIGPGQADPVFNYATHNTYLRVLSENGWIGFFAFYAFVALTLVESVRRVRRARPQDCLPLAVFASLAGWLVNALVIDTLHWRHLWLLLALPWVGEAFWRKHFGDRL
jgi:uncharacterized membrane protein